MEKIECVLNRSKYILKIPICTFSLSCSLMCIEILDYRKKVKLYFGKSIDFHDK